MWFATFVEHDDFPRKHRPQPYLLSAFVVCACIFDAIAWFSKDSIFMCWKKSYISSMYGEEDDTKTEITSTNLSMMMMIYDYCN